jgi:hypothetical protein
MAAFKKTGIWPVNRWQTVVMQRHRAKEERDAAWAVLTDAEPVTDNEGVTEAAIRAGVDHTPRTRRLELTPLVSDPTLTPRQQKAMTEGLLELAQRQSAAIVLRDDQLKDARAGSKGKSAPKGAMPHGASRVYTGAEIAAEDERIAGHKRADAAKKGEREAKKAAREAKKALGGAARKPTTGHRKPAGSHNALTHAWPRPNLPMSRTRMLTMMTTPQCLYSTIVNPQMSLTTM